MTSIVADAPLIASDFHASASRRPLKAGLANWSYDEAFKRNRGVLTEKEQETLRNSRVAIAGMGGVGGGHLITLARLGVGKFTIADPDTFEIANFNRQYGATISNLGRNKAEAMAEAALDINPELDIRVITNGIDETNIETFLEDANLFVDSLDFFVIGVRRLAFRCARANRIWGITAGPHAFGAGSILFSPDGISFDQYFDLHDDADEIDQLVAFAVGAVPAALHIRYLDLAEYFQPQKATASSVVAGCQLANGIAAAEIAKVLLSRSGVRPAPYYMQFDPYLQKLRCRRLYLCNRNPLQLLRRNWLRRKFASAKR